MVNEDLKSDITLETVSRAKEVQSQLIELKRMIVGDVNTIEELGDLFWLNTHTVE